MTGPVGVVDVGTNSVRLLIADATAGLLRYRERDLVITRLGEGVDGNGRLGDEPMRRTLDAIVAYAARCRAAGVTRTRIAATSAVRDARNQDAFLDAVRSATGHSVEVLSGEDEARLAFDGALSDLNERGPFLVVDIGGGSTEFIAGDRSAQRWLSVDIGSVRLYERHVRTDPPTPAEIEAVAADVAAPLERVQSAVAPHEASTLIGMAGTVTTAAAIALELPGYSRAAIHHARIGAAQVRAVLDRLLGLTSAQRRALPAMPAGREDVIVPGVVILERIMARFGFADCLVSESDILDGLALETAGA